MHRDDLRRLRAMPSLIGWGAIAAIVLAAACGRTGRVTRVLPPAESIRIDSLAASVDSGPPPLAIRFEAFVRGGTPPIEYQWWFGDGVRSDSLTSTHVYGALGEYDVRFVARDAAGDSAAGVRRVRVAAPRPNPLSVSIEARPARAMAPADVVISCSGTYGQPPYTYRIEFGDGSVSLRPSASHRYYASGRITATVTMVDARGDTARRSTVVDLLPRVPPVATVSAWPESGLVPLTTRFQTSMTGLAPFLYTWSFGDGTTLQGPSEAARTYNFARTYDVSVIVQDAAGQRDTAFTRVRATANPLMATVRVTPSRALPNVAISFSGAARQGVPPLRHLWRFGDGESATVAETTHAYRRPGSYLAEFTATDANGATVTMPAFVVVGDPLSCTAWASPVAGQAPLVVGFHAATGGGFEPVRYAWDFGDGGAGSGRDVDHQYRTAGTYRARLTVRDTASVCTTSVGVTVSPAGPVSFTASATPAVGPPPLDVSFRGDAIGARAPLEYLWEFGDGTGTRDAAPRHRYELPGVYVARVSLRDALSRSAEATMRVVVEAGEVLACSPMATPGSGYAPLATRLVSGVRAGRPPYSVEWDFGDGGRAAGEETDHVYAVAGDYTARVTVRDAAGDTTSGSVAVGVHDAASTTLEIVNDLAEAGEWERWNGLVGVRIGPDRAAVESADPAYERLGAADSVANLEDAAWILPTYRRQNASNTVRYDMTALGPRYFVRVALGWWDRRCATPDDCVWVKGRTMTQCCDCDAVNCPKAATAEVTDHFAGVVRLKLSDLLPDDHWCHSDRCARYMQVRHVAAGGGR